MKTTEKETTFGDVQTKSKGFFAEESEPLASSDVHQVEEGWTRTPI
jgi:hypothetical protein